MDSTIVIEEFQFPMNSSATPYNISDFSSTVKQFCHDEAEFLDKKFLKQSSRKDASRAKAALQQIAASCGQSRIAKCLVVGDVSVGKTCLVNRFVQQIWQKAAPTPGVDFEVQKFKILNKLHTLHIWDTSGDSRFEDLIRPYYRNFSAVLICFDLNNYESFLKLNHWFNLVNENRCHSIPASFIFFVGTKLDLLNSNPSQTAVIEIDDEALQFANMWNAEYWRVSSLDGTNVDELFERVACLTFNHHLELNAEQAQNDLEAIKVGFYSEPDLAIAQTEFELDFYMNLLTPSLKIFGLEQIQINDHNGTFSVIFPFKKRLQFRNCFTYEWTVNVTFNFKSSSDPMEKIQFIRSCANYFDLSVTCILRETFSVPKISLHS